MRTSLMSLALAVCVACGAAEPGAARHGWRVTSHSPVAALNEALTVEFSGALDPLSLTSRSVRVETADGRLLPVRVSAGATSLRVHLNVTEDLFRHPPTSLWVQLVGAPSIHALRSSSGQGLPTSERLEVRCRPGLVGEGVVRLRSVNGQGISSTGALHHEGSIRLLFDGVLDPGTVNSQSCPLFPVAAGLALKPFLPQTRWSLVGSECTVVLEVSPHAGPLELVWKRLGLRGLDGVPPEGPLVLSFSTS